MRTVAVKDVLWIEDVSLIETGHHAERQALAGVCLARDLGKSDGFAAQRLHGKLEPAALLENGTHDLLLNLSARVRDRCPRATIAHRAEDPVFVNEITWSDLQLIGRNLPDFIHNSTRGLVHCRATDANGSRIEST